jgi:hypothetical protein
MTPQWTFTFSLQEIMKDPRLVEDIPLEGIEVIGIEINSYCLQFFWYHTFPIGYFIPDKDKNKNKEYGNGPLFYSASLIVKHLNEKITQLKKIHRSVKSINYLT